MSKIAPYNPLDKLSLAKSIETALLKRPLDPLGDVKGITGAGVYVIYYSGPFFAYAELTKANLEDPGAKPIYVGKAIPEGGRKGGFRVEASAMGDSLLKRLRQHRASIQQVGNLDIADFKVKHLIVDDIWIPLGENILIETFKPAWNRVLDGFGNNAPGKGREQQVRSAWDTVHPGRKAAAKLPESPLGAEHWIERVRDFLAGKGLPELPAELEKQTEAALAEEA